MSAFVQSSSIIRRLTLLISATALFFLISFAGSYLSSVEFLRGLTRVNEANRLFSLSSRISESIDSSAQVLAEIGSERSPSGPETRDHESIFKSAIKQANEGLDDAIARAKGFSEVRKHLIQAKRSINQITETSGEVFAELRELPPGYPIPAGTASGLLVANQYELDAKDAIRKVQIDIRSLSDETFNSVYSARHRPLLVGISLAVIFFAFAGLIGLSITRRLAISVSNLLSATDAVARGDLGYTSKIYSNDEVGRLTHAFNEMVSRLREQRDRSRRLQDVTSGLSRALKPSEVATVILDHGLPPIGALGGSVCLLDLASGEFELLTSAGYPESVVTRWKRFSIEAHAPISDAARIRAPLWFSSLREVRERYPHLSAEEAGNTRALACLPLVVEGRVLGVMAVSFVDEREFGQEDREYLLSLAMLCGQAMHRAILFAETQEAVRVRDEFLSIASHELKTPLTPLLIQVQGISRLLVRGKLHSLPPERILKMLKTAEDQVGRLGRLVEELLDVARIGSGKLSVQPETTDLSRIVREVVNRFHHEFEVAHCPVRLELEPEVIGEWDPFRLEQVVTNLLTNAIRYGSGESIDIRVRAEGAVASLEVQDHGMGIQSKDQVRIFERFERASPSNHFGGLGLGLYITKQIVERHEGEIRVASEPGKGALFSVTLPRHRDPQKNAA